MLGQRHRRCCNNKRALAQNLVISVTYTGMCSSSVAIYTPCQDCIYHCHLYPLQSTNCCRNSRLVVYEDDLKWVANTKIYIAIIKTVT